MRKFLYFLIFFFESANICFSQGEWNNWYFGGHAAITFNSGSPVGISGNAMYQSGFTAGVSVSDSLGNILFYAYGRRVYNSNNVVMPNGDGLIGAFCCAQEIFSVPKINDYGKYYLFTVGYDGDFGPLVGLHYSLLDMQLNGGLGDIVPGIKNIPLPMGDSALNQLTGIRASNNKDVWIVVLRYGKHEQYLSYHITSDGLDTIPVISNSGLKRQLRSSSPTGDLRISPDGTNLFCMDSIAELCYFDNSTGVVIPRFRFQPVFNSQLYTITGNEFSLNSRYLYCCSSAILLTFKPCLQFDVTSVDSAQFLQSMVNIGYGPLGHMHMGPDWKIYAGCRIFSLDSLCRINEPNVHGIGCNLENNVVGLLGNPHNNCIPQFLQKYKAYIHHSNSCQNDSVHFNADIWPPADSIHWDFGDPVSGPSNFSNLPNTSHIYTNTGTYIIELFVRHNDNRTDTSWQTITIVASPQVILGPDRIICTGDSTTFDAGTCPVCTYVWKDLVSGLTVGTAQTFKTSQPGTYTVIVTNSNNCFGSDTVQLQTTQVPSVTNNPLSKILCSGDSTNIPLTSNVSGTIFHWTTSLTSGNITGYIADSGIIINQILANSLSTPGIVTYHITPKVGSCAGVTVDFPVTVNPGDSVKVSISASANNICEGMPVTFTASPTNGGSSPSYQWKVNGINAGTNSWTYTYNPASGDLVSCILTSNILCPNGNPATSNTITMTFNPNLPVSVTISASANPFCQGSSVTFTATPTNGGNNPNYQWKVNGINIGPNNTVYSYSPNNGDVVTCVMTSNIACPSGNPATSNSITMIVIANLTAGISIAASANPFCPGNSVIFIATPLNGGPAPAYHWKVNGINKGTNSSTYTYNPVSGDLITCILTSNLPCVTANPATSNTIIMSGTLASVVTFTRCNDSITTTNAQPFKLKGGIPLGGTYSGPGVTNGILYPAIAGAGTKTITYSYTNSALCSATANLQFVIRNPSFVICGSDLTDIRDNKIYHTIQIGSHCWLAEDLNYGVEIPSNTDQRDNCIPEKYHNPASSIQYPASVYQWDEIMNYDESISTQGLCPPGWHVPSEADWNTLFANYISNAFAASPLKYSGFSGFNALLNGARHMNKTWDYQGFATFFWSSTARGTLKAWAHGMNEADPSVSAYPAFRTNAFSVRCLKD